MPRPDVSEERKEQILNAAAIVFSQQGFANARMDDIVEKSGLSKGALYWYFKSKDEIILALMHRFFDQDLAGLDHLLEMNLSARETLLQYIDALVTEFDQVKDLAPLIYDYYSSATRDEEKQAFFRAYFRQYRTLMHDIIQRGIKANEFKSTDLDTFALTLTAIFEGLLLLYTIDESPVDLKQQLKRSVSLLLDSIQMS